MWSLSLFPRLDTRVIFFFCFCHCRHVPWRLPPSGSDSQLLVSSFSTTLPPTSLWQWLPQQLPDLDINWSCSVFEILNSEILLSDHNLWSFYEFPLFHALEIGSLVFLWCPASWPFLMLAVYHSLLTSSLFQPCLKNYFNHTLRNIWFSHLFALFYQDLVNELILIGPLVLSLSPYISLSLFHLLPFSVFLVQSV